MDRYDRKNWQKIKTHLEKVGKTDCLYYTRACQIVIGSDDPMPYRAEDWQ